MNILDSARAQSATYGLCLKNPSAGSPSSFSPSLGGLCTVPLGDLYVPFDPFHPRKQGVSRKKHLSLTNRTALNSTTSSASAPVQPRNPAPFHLESSKSLAISPISRNSTPRPLSSALICRLIVNRSTSEPCASKCRVFDRSLTFQLLTLNRRDPPQYFTFNL